MRRQCPVCDNVWFGRLPASIMKLKKVPCVCLLCDVTRDTFELVLCWVQVDFIWVNREQKSFEWFVSLLANIELQESEMQEGKSGEEHSIKEPFIDMQVCLAQCVLVVVKEEVTTLSCLADVHDGRSQHQRHEGPGAADGHGDHARGRRC